MKRLLLGIAMLGAAAVLWGCPIYSGNEYRVCQGSGCYSCPDSLVLGRLHHLAVPAGQRLRHRVRLRHDGTCVCLSRVRLRTRATSSNDCSVTGCPTGTCASCRTGSPSAWRSAAGDDGGTGATRARASGIDAATPATAGDSGDASTLRGGSITGTPATPTSTAAAHGARVRRRAVRAAGRALLGRNAVHRRGLVVRRRPLRGSLQHDAALPLRLRVRLHARRLQPEPRSVLGLGHVELPGRRDLRRGSLRPAVRRGRGGGRRLRRRPGLRQRRLHPGPGRHLRVRERRRRGAALQHVRQRSTCLHHDCYPGCAPTAATALRQRDVLQERHDRDGHVRRLRAARHARERLRSGAGQRTAAAGLRRRHLPVATRTLHSTRAHRPCARRARLPRAAPRLRVAGARRRQRRRRAETGSAASSAPTPPTTRRSP